VGFPQAAGGVEGVKDFIKLKNRARALRDRKLAKTLFIPMVYKITVWVKHRAAFG
jgi:hypothetical protein